jgi:hypothetical protein
VRIDQCSVNPRLAESLELPTEFDATSMEAGRSTACLVTDIVSPSQHDTSRTQTNSDGVSDAFPRRAYAVSDGVSDSEFFKRLDPATVQTEDLEVGMHRFKAVPGLQGKERLCVIKICGRAVDPEKRGDPTVSWLLKIAPNVGGGKHNGKKHELLLLFAQNVSAQAGSGVVGRTLRHGQNNQFRLCNIMFARPHCDRYQQLQRQPDKDDLTNNPLKAQKKQFWENVLEKFSIVKRTVRQLFTCIMSTHIFKILTQTILAYCLTSQISPWVPS